MLRSFYMLFAAAAFAAAFTLAPSARADITTLSGGCTVEVGADCTAACSGGIDCSVQLADSCSGGCTATPVTTCTKACETTCTTSPGTFSCSADCGGQCMTLCQKNNFYGAGSLTECVTSCQGQCSVSCQSSPAMTSCSSACANVCTAQENLMCSVTCQAKNSAMCTYTPVSCNASCSGGGAVVVCNGKVVEVADSIKAAEEWFVSTLDANFKISISASCTGDSCTATACDASPMTTEAGGTGLLLAGLSFAGTAVVRRRRRR